MKKLLLSLVVAIGCLNATAQTHVPCGNVEVYNKLYKEHPELLASEQAFDAQIAEFVKNAPAGSLEHTRAGEVIIPLVFHVIHAYGSEFVSDAQIYDAVSILNRDYNKQNGDTASVILPFKNLIGNSGFKFKLARKDPNGNCTNGIDRVYSYKTFKADDASKLNAWSRNYYFNIWMTNSIGANGVAGYAYKPQSLNGGFLNVYDGIIILHDYVGSIGTGSVPYSRALTHEMGHSLGLDHTWGGTNNPTIACGDDGVQDTPPTEGHDNCTAADLWDSICTPATGAPVVIGPIHNTQNYMEYSYCSKMFTPGQCEKMYNTSFLDGNAQRNQLITPLAWSVSGIDSTYAPCAPNADFSVNRWFTCIGDANVTLTNRTTDGSGFTHAWGIPNSTFNNSTLTSPSNVGFTTQGWQPISLASTNTNGTGTKAKNHTIYVSDKNDKYPMNYYENFTHQVNVDKWPIFNIYDNYFHWSVIQGGGRDGSPCIKMNTFDDRPGADKFFGTPAGDYDDFISPAFDLTGCVGCNVNFWSSGATTTTNYNDASDSMAVYYSTNCGTSWTKVDVALGTFTVNKNNLFNKLQSTNNYIPTNNSDWVARTIPLPAAAVSSTTYIKFHYRSSNASNNVYLDDIGVGNWATEVVDLMHRNDAFSIYPNPNNGTFSISVKYIENSNLVITDVTGKVIDNITNTPSSNNASIITVNKTLPSGVYFVSMMSKGVKLSTQKFVVSE
jgi:hypothetical protein